MLYSYKDVKVFVCEYDNEIQNELFIENYMAFKIYLNDLIWFNHFCYKFNQQGFILVGVVVGSLIDVHQRVVISQLQQMGCSAQHIINSWPFSSED